MKSKMESNTASLAAIGVDIGKEVFHFVGFTSTGGSPSEGESVAWVSKTLSRSCRRASSAWKPA
jgi:hypothetical protein